MIHWFDSVGPSQFVSIVLNTARRQAKCSWLLLLGCPGAPTDVLPRPGSGRPTTPTDKPVPGLLPTVWVWASRLRRRSEGRAPYPRDAPRGAPVHVCGVCPCVFVVRKSRRTCSTVPSTLVQWWQLLSWAHPILCMYGIWEWQCGVHSEVGTTGPDLRVGGVRFVCVRGEWPSGECWK